VGRTFGYGVRGIILRKLALGYGLDSERWVKAVERGERCALGHERVPGTLPGRIEAVFTRTHALEAYARAFQAELTPDLTGPRARIARNRAIEALRGRHASKRPRSFIRATI
jgi:hypothetical protein